MPVPAPGMMRLFFRHDYYHIKKLYPPSSTSLSRKSTFPKAFFETRQAHGIERFRFHQKKFFRKEVLRAPAVEATSNCCRVPISEKRIYAKHRLKKQEAFLTKPGLRARLASPKAVRPAGWVACFGPVPLCSF